jgi:hypothetical protein
MRGGFSFWLRRHGNFIENMPLALLLPAKFF